MEQPGVIGTLFSNGSLRTLKLLKNVKESLIQIPGWGKTFDG